jgi:hypothetical protein
VAGQWLVGQKSNNFKRQCFVESAVGKIATEKQASNRYMQPKETKELTLTNNLKLKSAKSAL